MNNLADEIRNLYTQLDNYNKVYPNGGGYRDKISDLLANCYDEISKLFEDKLFTNYLKPTKKYIWNQAFTSLQNEIQFIYFLDRNTKMIKGLYIYIYGAIEKKLMNLLIQKSGLALNNQ